MKVKVQVIGHETFETKKREIRHQLVCLDVEPEFRMFNTFDYSVAEIDRDKYGDPEKLVGKNVEIGIKQLEAGFGGRLRARGQITSVQKAA